jgi:hypothetical protein
MDLASVLMMRDITPVAKRLTGLTESYAYVSSHSFIVNAELRAQENVLMPVNIPYQVV